jgi:hypothetical protein
MKGRFVVAATFAGASLVVVSGASAQTASAPPMQSILAGKKVVAPVRGQAELDYTKPATTRKGGVVITKIQVKNTSNAPIARLRIIETWFDKSGGTIPGGEGVINGLLQPGEVQTIEIQTPYSDKLNANSWNFLHANGAVKPHLVKSLDAPAGKEPVAKAAAATKEPAAKTAAATTAKKK